MELRVLYSAEEADSGSFLSCSSSSYPQVSVCTTLFVLLSKLLDYKSSNLISKVDRMITKALAIAAMLVPD